MIRVLLALLLLVLPSSLVAQVQPVQPVAGPDEHPTVRAIAASFVLSSKFVPLADWAEQEGYRLDHRQIDGGATQESPEHLRKGTNFLIFDGPRPSDMAAVREAAGPFEELTVPWISVGGGPPAFGNLPPATARKLIGYYAAGGAANFRAFIRALPLVLAGQGIDSFPPPVLMPDTGYYHPEADQLFATPEEYRDWLVANGRGDLPVVAFAISDGYVRDMQTDVLDALAASLEAKGLVPAFFWYDRNAEDALTRMVRPLNAQALVNYTHMQGGEERKAEFRALDIPVVQAVGDRSASIQEWREAAGGVAGGPTAVMITVPETWGISDPIVVSALEDGAPVPIPEQVELLTGKLAKLVALRSKPAADKKLALFFWNYPPGEKNMAASNLNLPLSLEKLSADLAEAGYDVTPADEQQIITAGQAMLAGFYRPETLPQLLDSGLAVTLPVSTYKQWLATLPETRRADLQAAWGDPEDSEAVVDGQFIIPRYALGKLAIMPQPQRGRGTSKSYHDPAVPPDHRYLATYLWVREQQQADAIIHMGTHGTQEWTPGKDRGLWAYDYPFMMLGDVPVFYPYIQDNVAEAIQARRRGRAVTVSHQTPAFAPSGLYDELRDVHQLIHEYAQLETGPVRDRVAAALLAEARASHLDADLGWSDDDIAADFAGYYTELHDHLHQLARMSIPLGLHTFGKAHEDDRRLTTVMQQLGPDYLAALDMDPNEAFAGDFNEIQQSTPYRFLSRYLREGEDVASINDPALREQVETALRYDANLAEPGETEALLAGLAGRFVEAGSGGDPVRSPETTSGRNLYAFEASKVPAKAAYEEGGRALENMLAAYKVDHNGQLPRKMAFSVFSGETIRTLGVGEGQILHALGLRPVWGRGGRVEALEIIPLEELGRPRIDVLMQPTSVYRDQFDVFMRRLAGAIDRLAELDEDSGPAANSRRLEQALMEQGMEAEEARALSRLRIFTNAPGDYGTGLPDAISQGSLDPENGWQDEADLAEPWLERMQYAYGARDWGFSLEGSNLLSEQLQDVDVAVLGRSSNLHGMISTDHPFEHLGGMSLAIRHLTGKSPDLYVTDMRGQQARIVTAAGFISEEMRARYLNPHWVGEMQQEGYAGANAILGVVNNMWGWQVADPATVRADQWEAMLDTYVRDTRNLGLNEFFEEVHPDAQLQLVERLQEAIRRDYWQADDAAQQALASRNDQLKQLIAERDAEAGESGFGMQAVAATAPQPAQASAPQGAAAQPPAEAQAMPEAQLDTEPVKGRIMELQKPAESAAIPDLRGQLPALIAILLLFLGGAWLEIRSRRSSNLGNFANARA